MSGEPELLGVTARDATAIEEEVLAQVRKKATQLAPLQTPWVASRLGDAPPTYSSASSGLLQAQAAGEAAAPAAASADTDPAALQQQLRAVQRELRTVGAAVEVLQQQQEQQEQLEKQEQQEQQPAEQGQQDGEAGRAPPPASLPGDALQQAVMRQRLEGLQAQRQQL